MTRGDIGEYLGLTVETVSKLSTALQKKGLISVDNREIAYSRKTNSERSWVQTNSNSAIQANYRAKG